jgi:SAM-dependent methyltransferase
MYKKNENCCICGNDDLREVVDLGIQYLTGVFPKKKEEYLTSGPLKLVKCHGSEDCCGLVQLQNIYSLDEMYGDNYGYRSGLNQNMVNHLHGKIKRILEITSLDDGDLVIDIGSNDSTALQAYPNEKYKLVGIDPTGIKFKNYYPSHIELIPDFFSFDIINEKYNGKKAKIITSFSMFYDLEEPLKFMQDIYNTLTPDGIWVFEQSYLPAMLEKNSYDTICHEHLEYYSMKQIKWMADKIGFKIVDIEFNDINGGSFSITVSKKISNYYVASNLDEILNSEIKSGLDDLQIYFSFAERIKKSKDELISFIRKINKEGKKMYCLGASTKGNVLLQYCGITKNEIALIGEVNSDKYGSVTPGSWIPIVSEDEVLESNPDYLLVLPWHFRSFFENNNKFSNSKLVFPLPTLEILE